jgi:hypothetical protein
VLDDEDAMQRIAYRALALLICAVMFVGLIGARPLGSQPEHFISQAGMSAIDLLPPPPAHGSIPLAKAAPAAPRIEPVARRITREGARPAPAGDVAETAPVSAAEPVSRPEEGQLEVVADAAPAHIAGSGPWMRGQIVAQTERLDLYVGKNTFSPAQVAALAPLIEQALRDDERRFGTELQHRVSVGFYRQPPKKGVRGMAYTNQARAELFYRPGEDPTRATAIAAHELGHHLEAQRYGEAVQRRADTILHEGMATWIAADRWLPMCGATTWRQRARQLRNAGVPLRLLKAERSGADNAYELWASFVDFLAERYGWEKLDALYISSRGRAPGSANYERVLGKSIEELADDWRGWVE